MGFSAVGGCNCGHSTAHLAAQRGQIFSKMDSDQNGGLSVDELSSGKRGDFLIAHFIDIDTNSDGLMSADEGTVFFENLGVSGGSDDGAPPDGHPGFKISTASLQALINTLLEDAGKDHAQSVQRTADVVSRREENITPAAVAA